MRTIITGMHRSGSSMLAGLLQLCGLYLGSDLISGLQDNPKGHFEDKKFVALNDRILRMNGGSWKTPPQEILQAPVRDMKRWLGRWPSDRIVGWKDPRACITLGVWADLIPSLKVVVITRKPVEIAESLYARNRMQLQLGLQLTNNYHAHLVMNLRKKKLDHIVTSYPLLLGSPWAFELQRILEWIGLEQGDPGELEEFRAPELRHFGIS